MNIRMLFVISNVIAILILPLANAENYKRLPSRENAKVYIISPKNGETVDATFKVVFGLSGMGVSPAGIEKPFTGHHHLLIDGEITDYLKPLGNEVKHFGGGQTETFVTLKKGKHTLSLVLADHLHRPHSPAVVSEVITVEVK